MTLMNKIIRRIKVNQAERELSRLSRTILVDLGFDHQNRTRVVEDMIDTARSLKG